MDFISILSAVQQLCTGLKYPAFKIAILRIKTDIEPAFYEGDFMPLVLNGPKCGI
jgi:hypothetical protein